MFYLVVVDEENLRIEVVILFFRQLVLAHGSGLGSGHRSCEVGWESLNRVLAQRVRVVRLFKLCHLVRWVETSIRQTTPKKLLITKQSL